MRSERESLNQTESVQCSESNRLSFGKLLCVFAVRLVCPFVLSVAKLSLAGKGSCRLLRSPRRCLALETAGFALLFYMIKSQRRCRSANRLNGKLHVVSECPVCLRAVLTLPGFTGERALLPETNSRAAVLVMF
ncbi:hypothetical protein SRHO_G00069970 [Serrasalmus rhombeus]